MYERGYPRPTPPYPDDAAKSQDFARRNRDVIVPTAIAASILGISPDTVISYVRAGLLSGRKIGRGWRIDSASIEELMRRGSEDIKLELRAQRSLEQERIAKARMRAERERECSESEQRMIAFARAQQIVKSPPPDMPDFIVEMHRQILRDIDAQYAREAAEIAALHRPLPSEVNVPPPPPPPPPEPEMPPPPPPPYVEETLT